MDADPDPDPTFHFDADPVTSFKIKVQNLEKMFKQAHILYILACHLQINADPDLAYHLNVDPDPNFQSDADPCHLQINADTDLQQLIT